MDLVGAVVKRIRSVTETAEIVCVNKAQCQRLARRFDAIRTALEAMSGASHKDGVFAAMDQDLQQLLQVLENGEALVQNYADEKSALQNVLYRVDNHLAFKEVHEQIDRVSTFLAFENHASTDRTLSVDAEIDRRDMLPEVQKLNITAGADPDAERNLNAAITDKCFKADSVAEDLSFLNIPFSAISVGPPIKELGDHSKLSSWRDAHLAGLALVHLGKWNGIECAIKVFKSKKRDWNQQELQREVASLVRLRHPHITQLIGCAQKEEKTYVLYERMDSDLRAFMESKKKRRLLPESLQLNNRPFTRVEEVSIVTQIAYGMFYLHERNLVHGELKCSNVLVKKVASGHIDVKVADFHCSRQLGNLTLDTALYSPTHRPRWMPPEAFDHYKVPQPSDEILKKGDVYSFAMTCYEILTGKYPFDGLRGEKGKEEEFFAEHVKRRNERPSLPDDLSPTLKSLITLCWHKDYERRPSFQDICYVLKVDSVNILSTVQKILNSFCSFGSSAVADEPQVDDSKVWTDLIEFNKELPDENIHTRLTHDLPHYLRISPVDLKPGRRVGNGASAVVYEADWIGCRFAVKWLKFDHVEKLRDEVQLLVKLLHPHVIRLVGFSVLADRCAIVMELMEFSLLDFMNSKPKDPKRPPLTVPDSLAIMMKLALGMNFLHSRGVAHGDLKRENVLVRNSGAKISLLDVKIVDFGLSRLLLSSSATRPSVLGRCRSPEVIRCVDREVPVKDVDFKAADVYSFGMVCLEILTGNKPFHKVSDATANEIAKGGGLPDELDHVNVQQGVKSLLRDCWNIDPRKRPTFEKIVEKLAGLSK